MLLSIRKNLLFLFVVIGIFTMGAEARAGFGISPPYLKSDKLVPGSNYEQVITLLRSSADESLLVQVRVEAPDIESWITINNGEALELPKGKLQVPMKVTVDVPDSAEVGSYGGHINIKIIPKSQGNKGGVSIALGARIEIDLVITNKFIPDFRVLEASVGDFATLDWPWKWRIFARFFYRIKYAMKIENTGNVPIAPTKVHLDVYDITEKKLLESHDDKSFKKIEPYKTGTVMASFPTKLGPGQYWCRLKIYKDEQVIRADKDGLTIYHYEEFSGTTKLGKWPWILLSVYVLIILSIIFALIKIKIWRYIFKLLLALIWPFWFTWRKLIALWSFLKLKFWRWMHRKAAKYQEGGGEEAVVDNLEDEEE